MSEWMPIATAPRGRRKVIVLISDAGPNKYVTDPWTGWINSDGTASRWPHDFPPTHWMPLPKLHGEPSKPKFPAYQTTKAALDAMTDYERLDIFRLYCSHCGSTDPGCQCWNDE